MDSIHRLEELFAHFPGIGPRQAKRFVHYIQSKSPASVKELMDLIGEVKRSTNECSQCHRFFTKKVGINGTICSICSDKNRDSSTLMVVARDSDFETVEKSGAYKGLYFVLGGTVPILDKEPDKRIRLKGLLEYVSSSFSSTDNKAVTSSFKEIILSLNTTPDGEHTESIVKDALIKILPKSSPNLPVTNITILGRGLSTGAELEYADSETIRNALGNRR